MIGGREVAKFKGSRFSFKAAGSALFKWSITMYNHGKSGPEDELSIPYMLGHWILNSSQIYLKFSNYFISYISFKKFHAIVDLNATQFLKIVNMLSLMEPMHS